MKKNRKMKKWEQDFIYLAYPTEDTHKIASILNFSPHTIYNYAQKRKISKFSYAINIGDIYGDCTVINTTTQRLKNKTCYICKCICGNNVKKTIYNLFYHYNIKCKCKPVFDLQDVIKMYYEEYIHISDIAKKYKLGSNTIKRKLLANKIKIRNRKYYSALGTTGNRTGYAGMTGTLWGGCIRGAKNRNLEFTITKKYMWNLFLQQDKKCALSGVPLYFDKIAQRNSGNASIDRIDSSKGYIEGNVQWVHKTVNVIKMSLTTDELIDWCQKIINTRKKNVVY